jgi:glycosyltransferase involved in cell wall biosynthesis
MIKPMNMSQQQTEMTIVVPVHNRATLVERTLASIAAQTLRPLRVIVVDNNSTDNTLEVLQQWKAANETADLQIDVLTEVTPGAAAARNRGLQAVTTPYIMFFDSDDTMAPTHAARAIAAFADKNKPELVGWGHTIHMLNGTTIVRGFCKRDVLWHCIMHGTMGTLRWAATTELVRKAGGWDPSILGWDDIELGARMLLLKPRIKKLGGEITVDVYSQAESITGENFSGGHTKWERSLNAIEASIPGKRQRRYVNLRRAILAGCYLREGSAELSQALMATALAKEPCPFYRILLRLARVYTGAGHRGIARLLRPLF